MHLMLRRKGQTGTCGDRRVRKVGRCEGGTKGHIPTSTKFGEATITGKPLGYDHKVFD